MFQNMLLKIKVIENVYMECIYKSRTNSYFFLRYSFPLKCDLKLRGNVFNWFEFAAQV